jgi:hypothetical protein
MVETKLLSFQVVNSQIHTHFSTTLISNRYSYFGDLMSHQADSQVVPVGRVPRFINTVLNIKEIIT